MTTLNLCAEKLAEIRVSYSHPVPASQRMKITCSKDAADALRLIYTDVIEHHERFEIILLNRANQVLGYHKVSEGGLAGTVVDPKIVFQTALKANACSIILCHNHPSGGVRPSEADIKITKKLVDAGKMLDIDVLDHLIITSESQFSFADEGLI